jgi:glyoxylase-like metal-dependent hydrolase (beta-lactamase superfamily II)
VIVKSIPMGPLEANCYIVACEETLEGIVIDPGDEPDRIIEEIEDIEVVAIVLTHAHFDHVGAAGDIKEKTGAPIAVHEADVGLYGGVKDQAAFWGYKLDPLPAPDRLLSEGDIIEAGTLSFTVVHTPGHSPGSICLYVGNAVFTGDTLFAGSIGRTDFPGGSMSDMRESFRKLMRLPDETLVFSGHGPGTTIGQERAENIFAAEFLD